jgi:hypothetical protein
VITPLAAPLPAYERHFVFLWLKKRGRSNNKIMEGIQVIHVGEEAPKK